MVNYLGMGLESTYNTALSSIKRLYGTKKVRIERVRQSQAVEDISSLIPIEVYYAPPNLVNLEVSGALNYQIMPLILRSVAKFNTATAQDSGARYVHNFVPRQPTTNLDGMTVGIQAGSSYYRLSGFLGKSATISIDSNSANYTLSGVGHSGASTSFTLTDYTPSQVYPASPANITLSINGASKRAFSIDCTVSDGDFPITLGQASMLNQSEAVSQVAIKATYFETDLSAVKSLMDAERVANIIVDINSGVTLGSGAYRVYFNLANTYPVIEKVIEERKVYKVTATFRSFGTFSIDSHVNHNTYT